MLSVSISAIQLANGEVLQVPAHGVMLIVGPNSSGKSRFLHGIRQASRAPRWNNPQPPHAKSWIIDVEVAKTGGPDDLRDWFDRRARVRQFGHGEPVIARSIEDSWTFNDVRGVWVGRKLGEAEDLFIHDLSASMRTQIPLQAEARNSATDPAWQPLHHVWDSRELEHELAGWVRRAFGFSVCINRLDNRVTHLFRGEPYPHPMTLPPDDEALSWVHSLRRLDDEGDGVKGFVGLLLEAVIKPSSILLIDEPETFLHPPQAKLIGRYLSNKTPPTTQVFIATHSADVLQGALDAPGDKPVTLIRLDHDADGTRRLNTLDNDRVRELWTNPLLRSSRLLNGLFHSGVILCEADNDRCLYEAVLEAHISAEELQELDVVFVNVNGKAQIDKAIPYLREFGIQYAAIVDLDVLNNRALLNRVVAAAGGDFSRIEAKWDLLEKDRRTAGAGPSVAALKPLANKISTLRDSDLVPDWVAIKIKEELKVKSGWAQLKRSGLRDLGGDVLTAAEEILEYLRQLGVFVVPVGELERWHPRVTQRKDIHVAEVLQQRLHHKPEPELKQFIASVADRFLSRHP